MHFQNVIHTVQERKLHKQAWIFSPYLACQPGRYGINCAIPCGPNCQGCNRFTGVCEFGCHPEWTGTFCEKRSNYVFIYFCHINNSLHRIHIVFCITTNTKYSNMFWNISSRQILMYICVECILCLKNTDNFEKKKIITMWVVMIVEVEGYSSVTEKLLWLQHR